MKRATQLLLLAPALMLVVSASWAAGTATPDEAKALAVKAADYLKTVGPDKAFPEFDAKGNTTWHDRDLYVVVQDSNGLILAHGTNAGLIGKSLIDMRDVDGKAFTREMVAIKDAGWVDFKWQNPLTKAVEAKTTYEVRVGDYLVGVGAYAK